MAMTLPLMMLGVAGSGASAELRLPSAAKVRTTVDHLVDMLIGRHAPVPAVPEQESGTAAGKAHSVPAAVTRAVQNAVGREAGKGRGQVPAYAPHGLTARKFTSGPAVHGFSPKTSTLVQSGATATSNLYRNADGSYTRKVYAGADPVNYKTSAGGWAPINSSLTMGSGGRWQ
jgi:hypothetical protein